MALILRLKIVKSFDDERCLKEIEATLAIKNKADGVLFLLDEMGKALDFQSRSE